MNEALLNEDTIAAVATGLGGAGIGIIRVSGPEAVDIVTRLFVNHAGKTVEGAESHKLLYGNILEPEDGKIIDEVLVSKMKGPFSYTAEDVVEINCHGGIVSLKRILDAVIRSGARLEYSVGQLEGKLSQRLTAIDDLLIDVMANVEANIDYPEYDIEEVTAAYLNAHIHQAMDMVDMLLKASETGKIYREGITTAILGEPNVGKSSLLNTLLMENKAIVTEIPGTTRDIIEEYINIGGIPFKIIDTAGIRETDNLVEQIGVEKSRQLIKNTNLILFMTDLSRPFSEEEKTLIEELDPSKTIFIANKTDSMIENRDVPEGWLPLSLKEDEGVEALKDKMLEMVMGGSVDQEADYIVNNVRHVHLLEEAMACLKNALGTIDMGMPLELVSIDIQDGLEKIREITGRSVGSDIINQIFKNFCIGK